MRWLVLLSMLPLAAQDTPAPPPRFWSRFRPSLEFRTWLETRDGIAFGQQPDTSNVFIRTRFNLEFEASKSLRIGGTVQDARAPGYGRPAPGTAQDVADLHEAYVEFGTAKGNGWGGLAGRRRVLLGSGNLVGVPEWSNAGRTYDAARLFHRSPSMRLEAVFVSVVKFRPNDFDKPVLGDRVWGTYNAFTKWLPHGAVDLFLLRHDQNIPGGFSGRGGLGTTSFGGRAAGAIGKHVTYDTEIVGQGGHIGPLSHRALGYASNVTRKNVWGWTADWFAEYKYASGTDPRSGRSATFDQLYPANHDRFGHADVVGWRNIHNIRLGHRQRWGKHTTINATYTNNWLASARDAMYDLQGRPISRSPGGTAGRHIGQEAAVYTVHRFGHYQCGIAYAHWWLGEFPRNTTPGVTPHYAYFHQGVTF